MVSSLSRSLIQEALGLEGFGLRNLGGLEIEASTFFGDEKAVCFKLYGFGVCYSFAGHNQEETAARNLDPRTLQSPGVSTERGLWHPGFVQHAMGWVVVAT